MKISQWFVINKKWKKFPNKKRIKIEKTIIVDD
jgi:hypothetical protein